MLYLFENEIFVELLKGVLKVNISNVHIIFLMFQILTI